MSQNAPRPRHRRGWPAWAVTWLSILAASSVTAVVLARLSAEGTRVAIESALADHLRAQVGLADGSLSELPVEALVQLEGERSVEQLQAQIDALADAGGLRALVLLGPQGEVLGHQGQWLPGAAEQDLIAQAAAGQPSTGPLYRDQQGELYQTAYRALDGHPGWTVAAEGSAATLGAVGELERTQKAAGATVLVLVGLLGAGLAALVSRPVRRLGRELSAAHPGAPPSSIGDYGFREVRQVSAAGRELLAAIRARDNELQEAHHRELAQLTRMAAEIAHEVGNPLNAISLSVQRLATLDDPSRRASAMRRTTQQLGELEAIVDRLRDLTRPLRPAAAELDLDVLLDALATDLPQVDLQRRGDRGLRLLGDRVMLGEILRNLVLNAAQAGAETVTLELQAQAGGIQLTLWDDGPGIPEGEADQVFSWFHTTRAQGTGLGLPHARRVAEALGGSLELTSLVPATFRLLLPAASPTSPNPTEAHP